MPLPLLALLLALPPDSLRCGARAPRSAAPYDFTRAVGLAGEYDLVLVATAPRRGLRVSGRLELTPTDSLRRRTAPSLSSAGRRVAGLDRPLWGAATLVGDRLFDFAPLARRDPDRPAATLVADGWLLLSPGGPTAPQTELLVSRVSAGGFWGRWHERHALTVMAVADGNVGDAWEGYFCATRRGGSQPPGA